MSLKAQYCCWKLSAAWGKIGGDVLKFLCFVEVQSRIVGLLGCSWTKIGGNNEVVFQKKKKMQQTNIKVFPFHIMLNALVFVRAHRRNNLKTFGWMLLLRIEDHKMQLYSLQAPRTPTASSLSALNIVWQKNIWEIMYLFAVDSIVMTI